MDTHIFGIIRFDALLQKGSVKKDSPSLLSYIVTEVS